MTYMLVSSEDGICREWKKYEGYTVRPLPSVTKYYEKMVRQYGRQSACLMYGGTPEIRSIFRHEKIDITMIDKSEMVVKSLGKLADAGVSITENEHFLLTDWLNTKSMPKKHYQFVIGDDAINMVDWNNFNTFLKNTHDMMADDGYFICHLLLKPDDEYINKEFIDVYDEYQNGIIKSKYDLASRLNYICYDKKSYAMGWQQTIGRLGIEKLNKFKPEFDFCDIFGRCNSRFFCPPEDEFEALVSRYFTVKEIFYPHEHDYCLFEPIYLLQKKVIGGNHD